MRHLALAASMAAAAVLPVQASPAHAWISAPLPSTPAETYFSNLKDGASIETPFVLKFGLARYGLAPITKPVPHAGHHHLLVDRDLPLNFAQPLPFNAQYMHFGKGQMETVLDFAPGKYKLRLLLADDKHIPFFIYSKPLTVTVTRHRGDVDAKALVGPGVAMLAPAPGEALRGPFRVVFHASGLNVGSAEVADEGVGHFRLVANKAGAATERIDFSNGATEAWLNPPPGAYRLTLELVGNARGEVMSTSAPIDVKVVSGL
jgi:hypothetical protein